MKCSHPNREECDVDATGHCRDFPEHLLCNDCAKLHTEITGHTVIYHGRMAL